MYLLYAYSKKGEELPRGGRYEVKVFYPKLFPGKMKIRGEQLGLKSLLVRTSFLVLTMNRVAVYYVELDGKTAHTSYVIPKCVKFPFMKKNDYEIGPCFTASEFRGKGIYPDVIGHICSHLSDASGTFYMIVDDDNQPSIRGIEKAGFVRVGTVEKTKLLKRFVMKEQENEA